MNKRAVWSLYLLAGFLALATMWAYGTIIDIGVEAEGITMPEGGIINVISEAGGKIIRVLAREGETVHQGDILVELDPRALLLQQHLLEAQIHRKPHSTDLYLKLEQLHLALDQLTITSPAEGTIRSMPALHPGEILKAGTAVAEVIPTEGELIIESWLPANERRLVREGQTVRVHPEQGDSFNGEIASISPTYRVIIRPGRFAPPLCDGMTVKIHFITRQQRLLWVFLRVS